MAVSVIHSPLWRVTVQQRSVYAREADVREDGMQVPACGNESFFPHPCVFQSEIAGYYLRMTCRVFVKKRCMRYTVHI